MATSYGSSFGRAWGWKRSLGVVWSLAIHTLLSLLTSHLLTYLNKSIISSIGYEKFMRCPSGIWFNRILFIVVNTALLVTWGRQIVQEESWADEIRKWDQVVEFLESEREIRKWDEVVGYLEGERIRVEGVLAEEAKEQLRRESESAGTGVGGSGDGLGMGIGMRIKEEDAIPTIPSTVARRSIRPSSIQSSSTSISMANQANSIRTKPGTINSDPALATKPIPATKKTNIKAEMEKAVIDPSTLLDLNDRVYTPSAKMTVGRKAGLRMLGRKKSCDQEGERDCSDSEARFDDDN